MEAAQKKQLEETGHWWLPDAVFTLLRRLEEQDYSYRPRVDYGDCGLPALRRRYLRRVALRIAIIVGIAGLLANALL